MLFPIGSLKADFTSEPRASKFQFWR